MATLVAASVGLGFGSAAVVVRDGAALATDASTAPELQTGDALGLARAVSVELNAHDVDAFVELFTESDAGPSVSADRYAWLKSEIRLWAQQQADLNLSMDARDYRVTEQGAVWDADVYRDDWIAVGVAPLAVTNAIWVHDRKIAIFSEQPRNPIDAARLGILWRPGAVPERISNPPSTLRPGRVR